MSAFFHARQSSELLPEHSQRFNLKQPSSKKRGILHERSRSDINRDNGEQPTIRLVDTDSSNKNVYNKNPFPHMPSQVLQPPGSKHDYSSQKETGISGLGVSLHPQGDSGKLSSHSMSPKRSNNRHSANSQSTTASTTDTLFHDSAISPSSCRFSTDATLRNTPTPLMSEERELERLRGESLPALEEHSFESSTIRPVTASTPSDHTASRGSDRTPRRASYPVKPEYLPSEARAEATRPAGPAVNVSSPSEYSSSPPGPDHTRSSSWNIIRYARSNESIASVQYPQVRPPTAKSQSASSAWSSNEDESLPPLSVNRKRAHMHSASVGANRISNLSTIASESEASSRNVTRTNTNARLSESSSYDIFTSPREIAPSSSQSRNWYVRRRTITGSSSYSSLASDSQYNTISTMSSRWDVDREESAVPEPLFSSSPRAGQSSSPIVPMTGVMAAPVHELPGDHPSEQDDTIAELKAPMLRTKRSGHLSRARSQSEPRPASAQSNNSLIDRTSQGSSIFPMWAKSFYRSGVNLPNAYGSAASLSLADSQTSPSHSMRMMPWAYHRRWESVGNSFVDSTRTAGTPHTVSPRSSHFLPSIFRPYRSRRTPQSPSTNTTGTMSGTQSSLANVYTEDSRFDLSETESSRDSMAITPVVEPNHPPRRHLTVNSGRAVPREPTYSSSNYPQSLSASRVYNTPPHLAPSRRLSHRLSTWRAPSFDEALDTLVLSRGNRQILLFCIGFLFPISWMVAAFLPLPVRRMDMNNIEASVGDLSELNGEKGRLAFGVQMEMMDWEQEKRYLKARWWRNLNRIMSFVGVGIIAAIIALAVVATK